MADLMPIVPTVYMNRRDVTEWVESVTITQPDTAIYREFEITLLGWHNLEAGARWDIYTSFDASAPEAELSLRGGVVPPDRQPEFVVDGGVPKIKVKGFDSVWLMQRKRPQHTLVFVRQPSDVARALERYDGPVGATRTVVMWSNQTDGGICWRLARMAGFNLEYRMPRRDLVPFVMNPAFSYWDQIAELVKPHAPYLYFRGQAATLVVADPASAQAGTGSTMTLSENTIKSIQGLPSRQRRVHRVLMRLAT